MTPPLLKVLCEVEGIWEGELEGDDKIIDIRRQLDEEDSINEYDGGLPPPAPEKDEIIVISGPGDSIEDPDDVDTKSVLDDEECQRSGRVSPDNPSSFEYQASAEEDSLFSEGQAVSRRRKEIVDRSEVPTVYLDTKSHLSSSSRSSFQDPLEACPYNGSFVPHHYPREGGSSSSLPFSLDNNLPNSPSLPPLSSSAESIATPTSSSANPSFLDLSLDESEGLKDSEQLQRNESELSSARAKTPSIVEPESIGLRKRPVISNPIPITGPVHFPVARTKENSIPSTPSKRRSIPFLSLSNLSTHSGSELHNWELHTPVSASSSNGSSRHEEFRTKKPSLRLLFSKKSNSSLSDNLEKPKVGIPFLSNSTPQRLQDRPSPRTGSDSSISTPLSAVTAPQASSDSLCSVNDLPPVLDTLIENSCLKFDDFLVTGSHGSRTRSTVTNASNMNSTKRENAVLTTNSSSQMREQLDVRARPRRQPRLQPSSASLSLLDQDAAMDTKDEDWMSTVLIAANVASPEA